MTGFYLFGLRLSIPAMGLNGLIKVPTNAYLAVPRVTLCDDQVKLELAWEPHSCITLVVRSSCRRRQWRQRQAPQTLPCCRPLIKAPTTTLSDDLRPLRGWVGSKSHSMTSISIPKVRQTLFCWEEIISLCIHLMLLLLLNRSQTSSKIWRTQKWRRQL